MNNQQLSIAIAYHEEPIKFITEAVESIKSTIDVDEYEIIIVDDCSKVPLKLDIENVKVIRLAKPGGVGQALSAGVREAKYENAWIQGSDIRFLPNQWASKAIAGLNDHPTSIQCTMCVGLNQEKPENMDMERRMKISLRNGSTLLPYHDKKSNPKMTENFRDLWQCKWLPYDKDTTGCVEIPAVLGAAYITKRDMFLKVDPWKLHRQWGGLEGMLALAYWLQGGKHMCNHDVYTGHIFKRSSPHGIKIPNVLYNKMVLTHLFMPPAMAESMVQYLGSNGDLEQAHALFDIEKDRIFAERDRIQPQFTMDVYEFAKKFNLDLRL